MGFGERVSALLETYDNCLALLKAFKRNTDSRDGRKTSRKAAKTSEQQALLRHSLRTDKRKVERAYSSRVSESGSDFARGDAKARSALGRVLKRLNAAIASLMRLASKSSNPLMDYQSLISLSSSSRVQTIKAFDQLSRRVGSTNGGSSRGSVVSTRSKSSKATAATTTTNRSSRSGKTAKSDEKRKRHSRKPPVPDKPTTVCRKTTATHAIAEVPHDRINISRRRERDTGPPQLDTSIPTPMLDMVVAGDDGGFSVGEEQQRRRDISPLGRRASIMSRFSFMSMSSASTKLGEIPERRGRRRGSDGWPGADEGSLDEYYSTPTVYPLRPYQPVLKERRFMGLFRRGQ